MTASLYMFTSVEDSQRLLLFSSLLFCRCFGYCVKHLVLRCSLDNSSAEISPLQCASQLPSLRCFQRTKSLPGTQPERGVVVYALFVRFLCVEAAKLARYTAWQCLQVRAISVPPARSANLSRVNDLNNYDHAYNERFRV